MADTQDNDPSKGSQGGDAPKYVTEEQLNKAITGRLSEFQKKSEKSLETFASTLTGKLEEFVKAAVPAQKTTDTADPLKADDSPVVKGLQKQMEDLKKQAAALVAERDQERTRLRDSSLRQELTEHLLKNGVDAKRVKMAVGILVDSEKRVRFDDESGSIVFKDSDNTDIDLATGVKSWTGTDDGKLFLPPRGVNGSGDRGAGKAPITTDKSKAVDAETLGNLFLDQFGGVGR